MNSVTINGQSYELSPLRCKHLKQISALLTQDTQIVPGKGVYAEIEKWMPFIAQSIKIKNPTFDEALLDELTLQEFQDTWNAVVQMSSIREAQPITPSVQ